MTKLDCTNKVLKLRAKNTDEELCKLLFISKPTLYLRLRKHNWKPLEISHIKTLL